MGYNLKQVFCSAIPSSMINFREFVTEDDYGLVEDAASKFSERFNMSKRKFDIEMGPDKGDGSLAKIVQKMEYIEVDDSPKTIKKGMLSNVGTIPPISEEPGSLEQAEQQPNSAVETAA